LRAVGHDRHAALTDLHRGFEAGGDPSRSWPRITGGGRAITALPWERAIATTATTTELGDAAV
jgi:hypothetical protein